MNTWRGNLGTGTSMTAASCVTQEVPGWSRGGLPRAAPTFTPGACATCDSVSPESVERSRVTCGSLLRPRALFQPLCPEVGACLAAPLVHCGGLQPEIGRGGHLSCWGHMPIFGSLFLPKIGLLAAHSFSSVMKQSRQAY